MIDLTIYDPAMCCPTGICGANIDQKIVDFAADLDWLKSLGVGVKRINLSQEPALFAENPLVKTVLESSGVDGLPAIIAGDVLASSGVFPDRATLAEMAGLTAAQIAEGARAVTKSAGCCGDDTAREETPPSGGCCGGETETESEAHGCC